MKKNATFSECRKYRYALWRIWDDTKPYAMFIGLNPSTANETEDDPTIRRCVTFANDWGYGGLCMANLFAFRATDPQVMLSAIEPVGAENDFWLKTLAKDAGVIVGAWGNDGVFRNRSSEVLKIIPEIKCLKQNKTGEPSHPLYQPSSATPVALSI